MTKEQYQAQRKELIEAAQKSLDGGDVDAFNAKESEINALDAKFEEIGKAQANMRALQDRVPSEFGAKLMEGASFENKSSAATYENAWAKKMMGIPMDSDDLEVFNAVNLNIKNATAGQHAVLIPETVAADIWKLAGELHPIIADLGTSMTRVPGDFTIIKEVTGGDDAAWYAESDTVADGVLSFSELNLSGTELSKSIPVSWKLRKMAIDQFIPYISALLAEKMGNALAKSIVNGQGKPGNGQTFKAQPKGIVTTVTAEANAPQVVTYTATDKLSYAKLATALGKIKSQYANGASIYAKNETIWNSLAQILDGQNRPIFIPDVTSGGVGRIFGLVVKVEDAVADNDILIGNVQAGYAVNENEPMSVYTEEHVKQRITDYMAYSIIDGDVVTTKAFAYITKTA